jgi:DNA-binding transcriptional ArsR family regulator
MPRLMRDAVADRVFRVLADATRRGVVERLSRGPASVTELASPYEMALPSFMEHLKALEGAGLVRSTKQGRVRTYRLETERLRMAEDWLSAQRAVWERRLDQFDAYAKKIHARRRGAAGEESGRGS